MTLSSHPAGARRLKALLLDRDGTLIKDKHYLADPKGVELLPGVGQSLGALARLGLRFFLVSNQSGIGRGYFTEDAARAVNERLAAALEPFGARFDDIVFCPHAPEADCACRKPRTGMWETLRQRHGLAPEACAMVGDKEEDMRFASAAGLALRVLVLTGKGMETARRLDLSLPGNNYLQLVAPASAAHPHLLLPSFAHLPRGLELAELSLKDGGGR